jgi:deoxyribonuclease-4
LSADPLLVFGTAGVPHSAKRPSSLSGIARLRALGLDAMEVQFVQRVSMGVQTASDVQRAAREHSVRLSAHAPYYINLNAKDATKLAASRERLLRAAQVAAQCGAHNVVFHAAFYHDDAPHVVYERVKTQLQSMTEQLRAERVDVCLRPETSGRASQFGSLEEILQLSAEVQGIRPCIDFGHLHARTGGAVNTYGEFESVLARVAEFLGRGALQDLHMHVQGIAYGRAGERKHLILAESDLRYEELLRTWVDWGVGGTAICESPNLEEDALRLQRTYCRFVGEHQRTIARAFILNT